MELAWTSATRNVHHDASALAIFNQPHLGMSTVRNFPKDCIGISITRRTSSFSSSYHGISVPRRMSSGPLISAIHPISSTELLKSSTGFMDSRISNQMKWRFPGFLPNGGQSKGVGSLLALRASSQGMETLTFARWSLKKTEVKIVAASVATCLLATTNKILYKMALVPMKQYPFFLAQLNTFGYVLVYFTVLLWRYKAGIVTDDMLRVPKKQFVALGALEAMGLATGMAAAAVLPAASIPVLMQVFLVWQLLLSATFRGKQYTKGQIAGCLLVVAGVVIVVSSGGGTEALQQTGLLWPLVMIMSAFFSAGGSILKESIFEKAKHEVKGGNIDLFVVNSFGSACQALFVLLLLPLLSNLRGVPFLQLGAYFKDGAACLFNFGSPVACEGSPLLPLLYIVANLSFNVSALYLMKISSAILSSLCTTVSVPLAIFAFTLPLPYLGTPPALPPKLYLGSAILVFGLATYNLCNPKAQVKLD